MNRAIEWFAANHVVANLLMIFILVAGFMTVPTITKEIFPEFDLDMLSVSVPYLGAAPEEVEEGVCVKIEEAIQDLEGIKRITSSASEGVGTVTIELEAGADAREVLDDVKARVDAIETFPEQTEKPVVSELTNRRQVIDIAVHGDADEATLKALGDRVRDELAAIDGISQVELVSARPYEISIEVSEDALRRHGLTFGRVADAVRRSSLDMPGGTIRTRGGEILVRTKGQAYRGHEFEGLVLITRPDGTRLVLGDVATVVDGFAQTDESARFSGEPAVGVRVFRVGDQDPLEIVDKVKGYVAQARGRMPAGVTLTPWNDYSRFLQSRMDLMLRNARNGYILVFIILALFLKLRLAWWVSLGIPVSFLGALWVMPSLGVTINMISLFAFIVVLGIVVDDAIVIGENVSRKNEAGIAGVVGAANGAKEVAVPVVFGVLTTIAAFFPLLMVGGVMGKIMFVIPIIVIATLVFSLTESLFILPAHLSGGGSGRAAAGAAPAAARKSRTRVGAAWGNVQDWVSRSLRRFIDRVYRPVLEMGLKFRYATLALAAATLLVTIGTVGAGWIKFEFFPKVESDFISAALEMPPGTPVELTEAAIRTVEAGALALRREFEAEGSDDAPNPIRNIYTAIGGQPMSAQRSGGHGAPVDGFSAGNLGEVSIELAPSEDRSIASADVVKRWREKTPPIPDVISLRFSSSMFTPGQPVDVQLTGVDIPTLQAASEKLKRRLATYAGVTDVADSYRPGKEEIKLKIKPAAEAFGITQAELASQVRHAFYGEEAQRIQRGRDDVRVMVRYPEARRRSLADLEQMRIRTAAGGEVPFSMVAEAKTGRGYASIRRIDRQRAVNVTADVDTKVANAADVIADLRSGVLPELRAEYPGVSYSFEGQRREQADTMQGLRRGFAFALLAIFALMAIPFRSYTQPLIVMSVIPFGFVGAVWGHMIMGMNLTIISMFGFVALTGVVVNDSIVMVHFINERRKRGMTMGEAVRDAGPARFRAILLTSLTTFAGLSPLLLERSMQARIIVPMAVSLGFGVLFSTVVTLVLVPVSYLILEDVKVLAARLLGRPIGEPERATAGR